jgi:hypothetical protein
MDAVHHKAKQNTAHLPLGKPKLMSRRVPKGLIGITVRRHHEPDQMHVTAHFEDGSIINVPRRGTIEKTIEQILNLD